MEPPVAENRALSSDNVATEQEKIGVKWGLSYIVIHQLVQHLFILFKSLGWLWPVEADRRIYALGLVYAECLGKEHGSANKR